MISHHEAVHGAAKNLDVIELQLKEVTHRHEVCFLGFLLLLLLFWPRPAAYATLVLQPGNQTTSPFSAEHGVLTTAQPGSPSLLNCAGVISRPFGDMLRTGRCWMTCYEDWPWKL